MMLAGKGELRGWSFGFVAKDDEIEERSGKEPRRRVKALDLQEVSILSVMPAYNGTSIECRSYDECALPEDVDIVDDGVDDGTVEDVETVDTSAVDELRAYAELMKMKGYILRKREEQRALEMRYNHYHDPVNGRFASGKGGGTGLYYSMGKGKGAVVGASTHLTATIIAREEASKVEQEYYNGEEGKAFRERFRAEIPQHTREENERASRSRHNHVENYSKRVAQLEILSRLSPDRRNEGYYREEGKTLGVLRAQDKILREEFKKVYG
jgi:hypothetical protein